MEEVIVVKKTHFHDFSRSKRTDGIFGLDCAQERALLGLAWMASLNTETTFVRQISDEVTTELSCMCVFSSHT